MSFLNHVTHVVGHHVVHYVTNNLAKDVKKVAGTVSDNLNKQNKTSKK